MQIERKTRIRLEAFTETWNVFILMLVVSIYIIRPEPIPLLLLLITMVGEAFYLVFVPEWWRYHKWLAAYFCSEADKARDKLRQNTFSHPDHGIQGHEALATLSGLEKERNQIMAFLKRLPKEFKHYNENRAQDKNPYKPVCIVQRDLEYLLDWFLLLAWEETRLHGKISSELLSVEKQFGLSDNIDAPAGSEKWEEQAASRICEGYDLMINEKENEQKTKRWAGVEDQVDRLKKSKSNTENWPQLLKMYREGRNSIESTFRKVSAAFENPLPDNDYKLNEAMIIINATSVEIAAIVKGIEELPFTRDRLGIGNLMKSSWSWLANDKRKQKLMFSLVFGAVVIMMFGFGADRLDSLRVSYGFHYKITNWKGWEMGALFWNLAFAAWFYWTFKFPSSQRLVKVIPLFVILGIGVLTALDLYTLVIEPNSRLHIISVLGIGLVFLLVDFMLSRYHDDPNEQQTYFESMLVADLPVAGAFFVLLFFLLSYADVNEERDMEIFFSGAISFQLIASNVLFALLQGDMLRRPARTGFTSEQALGD